MNDSVAPSMRWLRSLGIICLSVIFAVCAALVALSLVSMNWPIAAVAVFVAAGVGFFGSKHYRGDEAGPNFWPMASVWMVTTAMMLSALIASR